MKEGAAVNGANRDGGVADANIVSKGPGMRALDAGRKEKMATQKIEIEVQQYKKRRLNVVEKVIELSIEKEAPTEVNVDKGKPGAMNFSPDAKNLDLTRGIIGKRDGMKGNMHRPR